MLFKKINKQLNLQTELRTQLLIRHLKGHRLLKHHNSLERHGEFVQCLAEITLLWNICEKFNKHEFIFQDRYYETEAGDV